MARIVLVPSKSSNSNNSSNSRSWQVEKEPEPLLYREKVSIKQFAMFLDSFCRPIPIVDVFFPGVPYISFSAPIVLAESQWKPHCRFHDTVLHLLRSLAFGLPLGFIFLSLICLPSSVSTITWKRHMHRNIPTLAFCHNTNQAHLLHRTISSRHFLSALRS